MASANESHDILKEFHEDTLRWKSIIGYTENEILFLTKLLNSKAFKGSTPNLYEKLEIFKKDLKAITEETKKLKKEVMEYLIDLKGMMECEDIQCDTFYSDSHKRFKKSFENYFLDFNEYKAQVFNITGGVL